VTSVTVLFCLPVQKSFLIITRQPMSTIGFRVMAKNDFCTAAARQLEFKKVRRTDERTDGVA